MDDDNFYALMIAANGSFSIEKRANGGWTSLERGFSSTIRRGRAVNAIVADCTGAPGRPVALTLRVNGVRVARTIDRERPHGPGNVGLVAESRGTPMTDVAFDKFVLRTV